LTLIDAKHEHPNPALALISVYQRFSESAEGWIGGLFSTQGGAYVA